MNLYKGLCTVLLATLFSVSVQAMEVNELPDPTNPYGPVAGAAPARGVQSILITPRRKQAIIHGRTFNVGDRVDNAVIVDILPYEVILNDGGHEKRMRLVPSLDKRKKEGGAS
jgi:hypothetical protein